LVSRLKLHRAQEALAQVANQKPMPEAGHGAEEYDLLGYATGRGHLYVDHPLHHPFSHPFRPPSVAALAVACGRSRETAPTAPVPEVPEEDVEAVPPLGGWYHLLLQVRKMVLQRRNHLRARNDPRGAGKRPPHHQKPARRTAAGSRSSPEADKGYLTLREGATRYGQFPRTHLLGCLVNRGNEVASYYVGKRLTVRLVRLARWVSRGAGGATRRAPHAGRPRTPRQTGA
jgi:hypothetical protein